MVVLITILFALGVMFYIDITEAAKKDVARAKLKKQMKYEYGNKNKPKV